MKTNRVLGTMGTLLLGLSLAVLSGGRATAQDVTGAVQGVCVSSEGQPEPGVHVILSGPHLQGSRETWTDRLGVFRFLAVPPGAYALRAERIGLQSVEVQEIVVELGRTTTLPDLTMSPQPIITESVVVRLPEIAIDPIHAAAGGTLDERDYAALPVDRDYKSLISILPHASVSYRGEPVNVGGSTGVENQYYIDGMNVTDTKSADRGTSLPYNFVRAVEVQTAGYEAQYGRALGAVVNAVTYSGTNDFEVQAFGFVEPSSLARESRTTTVLTEEGAVSYDVGVRVGGPIVRDRLWYSAAVNPRTIDVDKEIPGFGVFTDSSHALRYAGKLTWQASPATNLELSVFGDPTDRDAVTGWGAVTTVVHPDPLLAVEKTGGTVASLHATVTLSSSALFEASVAQQRDRLSSLPATVRGASEEWYWDQVEQSLDGGFLNRWEENRNRTSLTAKATVIVPRHTLVAGLDYQDAEVYSSLVNAFTARIGDTSWVRGWQSGEGTFHNRSPAVYVQDNWRLTDRFTFSPGLRWSGQYLVGASRRTDQRITDEWQPRIGFSWQLGPERKQRLFGSYGRYYLTVPTTMAIWYMGDSLVVYAYYSTDPRDPDSTPDYVLDGNMLEADWEEIPGLQAENFDESTLGYERLLGSRSKLTFRVMRRDLRSAFTDGMDTSTGDPVVGTPGEGDLAFMLPAEREYTALEVSAEGAWRRARYRASYVLSRTWGNYPGPPPQGIYIPEQVKNCTGYLPNDRTHVFKVSGDYPTSFGLSGGLVLTFGTGTPINDYGPSAYGGTLVPIFVSPRGSAGRSPSLWDLNLRLTYVLPIARQRPLQLLLDVLHVGNPQRAVSVDEMHYLTVDENGNSATINPQYGQPIAYQSPMALRLGIQATF